MPSFRYRINPGCSIALPAGAENVLLKPGQYLPDDYPATHIPALIHEGKITAENYTAYPNQVKDVPVANPPGAQGRPGLSHKDDADSAGGVGNTGETPIQITGNGGSIGEPRHQVVQPFVPGEPVTSPPSRWTVDPSGLQAMTLDQLNVMIAERDPTVQPYTDVKEAIAQLSLHFAPLK